MRLTLLPCLLLGAALLVAGCTSDPDPEAFRPPPPGSLAGGPCDLVADDLVALGRLAFDLRGEPDPGRSAAEALENAQDRVAAVAETADPVVKPALDRLVLTTGLVRLQVDTRMLRDQVLENMDVAYDEAVRACSTRAPSGAPSG